MKVLKKIVKLAFCLINPTVDYIWSTFINRKSRVMFLDSEYSSIDALHDLNKEGIIRINRNPSFYEKVLADIGNEVINDATEELQSRSDELSFVKNILPNASKSLKIHLLEHALSKENLSIILPYLGFIPRISSIVILLNIPSQKEEGSKEWHRDSQVHKGVNVFSCISHLDESNGIYSAVPLSIIDSRNVIKVKLDQEKSAWSNSRVTNSQMLNYADDNNIFRLYGPPGSTAIVASGDVYHKGGHCIDKNRLMLEISYQSDIYMGVNILKNLGLSISDLPTSITNDPLKMFMINGYQKEERSLFDSLIFSISRLGRYEI